MVSSGLFYFVRMERSLVSLIVAIANDGSIGKDNGLLWHIKDDLKLFMRTTSQHVVIHGRKSFESIGKPLPNRTNIIVTRDRSYSYPGCFVAHDLQDALELGQRLEQNGEIFILGGAQIYAQSLDKVDRMYISHVDAFFPDADAHFPDLDLDEWELLDFVRYSKSERNEYGFSFAIYEPHPV